MKSMILALCVAAALVQSVLAATPAPAEYKRADANFYWKSDVLAVNSDAVILSPSEYTQQGETYIVPADRHAPHTIYAEVMKDWVEPITPPGAASLDVPPTAMQILDPQGDVQVAFPAAPALYVPVQNGMTIANGTVVRTGANGTAAVVFGGMASARFTPNSEAAVQQNIAAAVRSTEIDLTRGAVFSKVGKPINEKEDYTVHTPFGVAAARGTDFVTVAMPTRTDVWIAEGTVRLSQPHGGPMVGEISADGGGPLKIVRFPAMPDEHASMMASAQTMTTAMNFIPMANRYISDLRDRLAKGETLTADETKYLSLIKKVPCLVKLTLVPAVPAPPAPPKPGAASPKPATTPAKSAASSSSATMFTSNTPAKPETTPAASPATPAASATNTPPASVAPPASQQPPATSIP